MLPTDDFYSESETNKLLAAYRHLFGPITSELRTYWDLDRKRDWGCLTTDYEKASYERLLEASKRAVHVERTIAETQARGTALYDITRDLRVGLSVAAASSGVYEMFAATNKYSVPAHLAPHCFTAESTALIKNQLEVEIARRSNQLAREKGLKNYRISRLAEVDAGPLQLNPELFSAERILVDSGARKALLGEGMPLYPYLNLHGLGCFGDISLEEVESNWAALERRETVRSRYRLKWHELVVSTTFVPDEHGELQPSVEVTAQRLP